jgi:hypothetical protein
MTFSSPPLHSIVVVFQGGREAGVEMEKKCIK